jgi:uncharacterized protein (DUF1015 family)
LLGNEISLKGPSVYSDPLMAEIRAFRGLRYTAEAGLIGALTAPPYDVLSATERDEYAARNAHNIVHLTLPEGSKDDRSQFVRYTRSAAALAEWRKEGALALEAQPAIYRYTQQFSLDPFLPESERKGAANLLERTSFIALLKVEPYSAGIVLPHEQTFPKHKEDRLRLLEATNSHLECIFGLYEDPSGDLLETLKQSPSAETIATTSDDGVFQKLEPIYDPAALTALVDGLASRKVWIADGHHRYETALGFRESKGPHGERIAEDYLMMAFSSLSDPGLVLLPTHRIVSGLNLTADQLREILSPEFELRSVSSEALVSDLAATPGAFGLALPGESLLLVPKDLAKLRSLGSSTGSEALRALDVSVLHGAILESMLGIKGTDKLAYTRDPAEALSAPSTEGGLKVSFLMNPPTVDDMRTIALGGEKMPQKSTYYFPKILSGLVLWSLRDFEPGAATTAS